MQLSNHLYLRELDNALALGRHDSVRSFNKDAYKYYGIQNGFIIYLLDHLFHVFRLLIVFVSLIYIYINFIICEIKLLFKKSVACNVKDENLFLFFLPLFYSRCKLADLYDNSKYWIVGGVIDVCNYKLDGKTLLDYRIVLDNKDYYKILKQSIGTIMEYVLKYDCYYTVYKTWSYYETYVGLKKITKDNNIFFSNQSDRWAIMFDALPSKSKTLIQHGIASPTIVCPAQLLRIDTMYAISKQTVDDMLYSVLNCRPEIKYLKPTICLTEISSDKKTVLLVAHIMFFEQEMKILKILYDTGFDIWLKKHPEVKNDSCYKDLQIEYDYHYITDAIFPKVDCVVSYQSTLAYEYMMFNVPTFIYDQNEGVDDDKLYKFLSNVKS